MPFIPKIEIRREIRQIEREEAKKEKEKEAKEKNNDSCVIL
jgi:hypothetical protein